MKNDVFSIFLFASFWQQREYVFAKMIRIKKLKHLSAELDHKDRLTGKNTFLYSTAIIGKIDQTVF